MLARPARNFEHHALRRQPFAEHRGNRIAVAQRRGGVAAGTAPTIPGHPGLRAHFARASARARRSRTISHASNPTGPASSVRTSKGNWRSEEHKSELQSRMRTSYDVISFEKKTNHIT